ncbi:MAG: acyltransferase domain-containing protein [Actinomycetes bacterium]
MLVIVAPGQGAQTPGFLTPWLTLPGVADRLGWLSACADLDLVQHGTVSDAATITDTAVAQPLLVAAGLVTALALFPHPSDAVGVVGAVAGHSVGELTAAVGAGVVSAEQAMVLVRERGRAMAAASTRAKTGMTAVIGGDREQVLATLARHGLTPANINGAHQIVAAGTREQLAALSDEPPVRARLIPLPVAGAFHTDHMAAAVRTLGALAGSVSVRDARIRLVSNRDGQVVHHGRDVLDRIVAQVAAPVRWDRCMDTLGDLGATGVLEIPPAGTLTGLVRRELPGVEAFALKSPEDLPAAREFVARHGGAPGGDDSPTWRLVVAPVKGTFRADAVVLGATLDSHSSIGAVMVRDQVHPVQAPYGGTVIEWLVEDGDPVSPGQPLVRLHPTVRTA